MPYKNEYGTDLGYDEIAHILKQPWVPEALKKAAEDAKSQDLYIMDPYGIITTKEVEEAWDRYQSMTKPFRRRSDWIMLERIGLTNQQLYDYMYNQSLGHVTQLPMTDGNVGTSEDPIYNMRENYLQYIPPNNEVPDMENLIANIEDFELKRQEAEEYMRQTGYIILIPGVYADLDSLEHAYYAFQSMIHRHREMSNWKAMELFGMTNDQLYISIRRYLDLQDGSEIDLGIDPNAKSYISEMGAIRKYFTKVIQEGDITNHELEVGLDRLQASQVEGYDKIVSKQIAVDMQDMFDGLSQNIPSATIDYTDLPAYTPDELIDLGVYKGGDPESPTGGDDMVMGGKLFNEKWFDEYCTFYQTNIMTEEYNELNKERIHRLERMYSRPVEERKSNLWYETVLSLGWNPNAEFSPVNRVINDGFMLEHYQKMVNHYDIVDISQESVSPYTESFDSTTTFQPIFIVLSSGKGAFSDLIKGITNSNYSHAMLSLDPSLHRCYSFGMDFKVKKTGSFIIEDVPKKFKDNFIRVYTIFVSSKIYETIKKNVEWFVENQKKTIYGWRNLISYLFRVPWERDHAMICSQFVDRMLKLGHIDFTKKSSSLIAPADLDRMAIRSKKIYQLFKDKANKWNPDKMMTKIKSILSRDRTYKWEGFLPVDSLAGVVVQEIKDIPVQIQRNGDVLVRNLKPMDYDAEFAKSHKLLVEYDKQNNTEAMKVELAKLWSYLMDIEEKLYGTRSLSSSKRKDLFKVRAMIIGDFKKYMEVVQRSEKNFDFGTYFENSPYSKSTYRISGSTIHGLLKLVKDVL